MEMSLSLDIYNSVAFYEWTNVSYNIILMQADIWRNIFTLMYTECIVITVYLLKMWFSRRKRDTPLI